MDIKKLPLKQIRFIAVLVILIIVFLLLGYTVSRAYINKTTFENEILNIASKNEETIFSIDNITLFSSAYADSEIQQNSALKLSNLYQYTDIAIFLNPVSEELSMKNTLKEVYINNINYTPSPIDGTPELYYKNISAFATHDYLEENKIEDTLHFNISSEDSADLNTPTLYNNCANPITLSYVNNVKDEYTFPDAFSQITYDGSLLKGCGVTISSIKAGVSFDIHIVNNLDHEFVCPIYIEIPLEANDGTSIYDGKVLVKNKTNYAFYRYN